MGSTGRSAQGERDARNELDGVCVGLASHAIPAIIAADATTAPTTRLRNGCGKSNRYGLRFAGVSGLCRWRCQSATFRDHYDCLGLHQRSPYCFSPIHNIQLPKPLKTSGNLRQVLKCTSSGDSSRAAIGHLCIWSYF